MKRPLITRLVPFAETAWFSRAPVRYCHCRYSTWRRSRRRRPTSFSRGSSMPSPRQPPNRLTVLYRIPASLPANRPPDRLSVLNRPPDLPTGQPSVCPIDLSTGQPSYTDLPTSRLPNRQTVLYRPLDLPTSQPAVRPIPTSRSRPPDRPSVAP